MWDGFQSNTEAIESMGFFGLFYDGVLWDIPGEGGAACWSYLPVKQRALETVIYTVASILVLMWSMPKLKLPMDRQYKINRSTLFTGITVVHCLVFGAELGHKISSRSLIFIFNPCHMLTAIQVSFLFYTTL